MKELRMKKLLVMSLLAFATCGFAQDSQSAQPGQTAPGQQPGAQPPAQPGQTASGQQPGAQPLQVNPSNVRALALITYLTRQQCSQGQQQACDQAAQYAQRGLQAADSMPKPAGVSDADFTKLQNGVKVIFNGAIGMGAIQKK